MADNVQKRGGFVPGIRPGKETSIVYKQDINASMSAVMSM
jgi:preprotein translocase subunit SecY